MGEIAVVGFVADAAAEFHDGANKSRERKRKRPLARPFRVNCSVLPSALARLETRVALADHENLATPAHDLAIAVTALGGLERRKHFHGSDLGANGLRKARQYSETVFLCKAGTSRAPSVTRRPLCVFRDPCAFSRRAEPPNAIPQSRSCGSVPGSRGMAVGAVATAESAARVPACVDSRAGLRLISRPIRPTLWG